MQIHADFSARVVLDSSTMPWLASPQPGVDRRMLDRVGDEVARATSIVRYAPGSRFAAHEHALGEEILVLSGVFGDEQGEHAAGTYLRNPPGTRHAPYSEVGCELFVKLRQFQSGDHAQLRIDARGAGFVTAGTPGVQLLALHAFAGEQVSLQRWAPGTRSAPHAHPGGEEILVLEGVFGDELGDYPAGTWLRNPHGSSHAPFSASGCLLYVKAGHLPSEPLR